MNLFKSLRDTLSPPSTTPKSFPLPLGLTSAEWNALKRLETSDEWKTFLKALDGVVKIQGDKIIQSSKVEVIHYSRGYVSGLRRIASLIPEIRRKEEDFLNSQKKHDRTRDTSSLYGSPGWRSKRSPGASA